MSNKEDNTPECIKHLEKLLSILKAKEADNKEPEWYERKPFKKTICWVNDNVENFAKGGKLQLIVDYDKDLDMPFRVGSDYGHRYAVPIPTNNLLEYSLEHQMEQEK